MCEFEVNFSDRMESDRIIGEGWAECVPFGRWMAGNRSTLALPPPPRCCAWFDATIVVGPFWAPGRQPDQKLIISVGDTILLEITLDNMAELQFRIPGDLVQVDRMLDIAFDHPGAIDSEHGSGAEARALSISTLSIIGVAGEILDELQFPPGTPAFIHVRSKGNLGNRMIQFMLALSVAQRAVNCVMSGVELDEWGLSTGTHVHGWSDLLVDQEQHIDLFSVCQYLATHPGRKVVYRGYGQRMENFLPLDIYRSIFAPLNLEVPLFDQRYLVINVRGGDVVSGRFRDYVLIPTEFYRQIIAKTGLTPVFMGQLGPNIYSDLLRSTFPAALFLESQGQLWDFEVIRRAANIVTCVSTFSWMAAWLSNATRIFMPVNGMLNPLQYPKVDLLPIGDTRFVFYLFPTNHAVPPEDLPAAHAALDNRWCQVSHAMMSEIRMRANS